MPAPTYSAVVEWAPPNLWGAVITIAAIVSLNARWGVWGCRAAALWNFAFSAAFLWAWMRLGGAWTAWSAYAFAGCVWMFVSFRVDHFSRGCRCD